MKTRYFPVYRSSSHSYLRFVLIALPLFVFWLAGETGFPFLYAVSVGTLCLCLPFLAMLYPVLRVDSKGIRLIRLPGKNHSLRWEDIRCHGCLRIPYHGSAASAELYYFSRNPLPSGITSQGTLPKLQEDFLFAFVQPGLSEAVGHYLT